MLNEQVTFLQSQLDGKAETALRTQQEMADRTNALRLQLEGCKNSMQQQAKLYEATEARLKSQLQRTEDELALARAELEERAMEAERKSAQAANEAALVAALKRTRDDLSKRLESLRMACDAMSKERDEALGARDRAIADLRAVREAAEAETKRADQLAAELKAAKELSYAQIAEIDKLKDQLSNYGISFGLSDETSSDMSAGPALPENITVVEAYKKYVAATQELRKVERNARALDNRAKELESERTQLMTTLEEERKKQSRVLESHAKLTFALRDVNQKFKELQEKHTELVTTSAALRRERDLAAVENLELSRQVKHLLSRAAGLPAPANESEPALEHALAEPIPGDADLGLPVVVGLDQLHEAYRKVIRMCRESNMALNQAKEREKSMTTLISDLTAKVEQNRQLADVVRALKAERAALEEKFNKLSEASELARQASASIGEGESPELQELREREARARAELDALKQRCAELEETLEATNAKLEEAAQAAARDLKALQDQLEAERKSASSTRLQLARETNQCKRLQEANESLQASLKLTKEELDQLRASSALQQSNSERLQEQVVILSQKLSIAEEAQRRAKAEADSAKLRLEASAEAEERLLREISRLHSQHERQAALLEEMQKVQMGLRDNDLEAKRKLVEEVRSLRDEIANKTRQLEEERNERRMLQAQFQNELQAERKLVEEANSQANAAREEALRLSGSLAAARDHSERLEQQLLSAQQRIEALVLASVGVASVEGGKKNDSTAHETGQTDARPDLEAARAEIESLQKELTETQEQLTRMTRMASTTEASLLKLSTTFQNYKEHAEAEAKKHTAEIEALEEQRQNLLARIESLVQSSKQSDAEHQEQIAELEAKLTSAARTQSSLEEEVASLTDQLEDLQETCAAVKRECEAQTARAEEAHANYQRELLKHGESVRNLVQARESAEQARQEYLAEKARLENELAETKLLLERSTMNAADLKTQLERAEQKATQLSRQNDLLLSQLEHQATQLRRIQESDLSGNLSMLLDASLPQAAEGASVADSDAQVRQLREIVTFLKNEKEVATLELERCKQDNVALEEQLRHQQKITKGLEERVKSLVQQLSEFSDQTAEGEEATLDITVSPDSGRPFFTPIKKPTGRGVRTPPDSQQRPSAVDTQSILLESNKALRLEAQESARKLAEAEAKLEEVRAQLKPLQDRIEELTIQKEFAERECKVAQEENERWRKRNSMLIDKYRQVDVEVHEQVLLDKQLVESSLAATKEALEAETQRANGLTASLAEAQAIIKQLEQTLEETRAELSACMSKLDASQKEVAELTAKQQELTAERTKLQASHNQLRASFEKLQADFNAVQNNQAAVSESQHAELQQRVEALTQAKTILAKQVKDLLAVLVRSEVLLVKQKSTLAESATQQEQLAARLQAESKEAIERIMKESEERIQAKTRALAEANKKHATDLESNQKKVEEEKNRSKALETRVESLAAELADSSAQVAKLEQELSRLREVEAHAQALEAELKRARSLANAAMELEPVVSDSISSMVAFLGKRKSTESSQEPPQAENDGTTQAVKKVRQDERLTAEQAIAPTKLTDSSLETGEYEAEEQPPNAAEEVDAYADEGEEEVEAVGQSELVVEAAEAAEAAETAEAAEAAEATEATEAAEAAEAAEMAEAAEAAEAPEAAEAAAETADTEVEVEGEAGTEELGGDGPEPMADGEIEASNEFEGPLGDEAGEAEASAEAQVDAQDESADAVVDSDSMQAGAEPVPDGEGEGETELGEAAGAEEIFAESSEANPSVGLTADAFAVSPADAYEALVQVDDNEDIHADEDEDADEGNEDEDEDEDQGHKQDEDEDEDEDEDGNEDEDEDEDDGHSHDGLENEEENDGLEEDAAIEEDYEGYAMLEGDDQGRDVVDDTTGPVDDTEASVKLASPSSSASKIFDGLAGAASEVASAFGSSNSLFGF